VPGWGEEVGEGLIIVFTVVVIVVALREWAAIDDRGGLEMGEEVLLRGWEMGEVDEVNARARGALAERGEFTLNCGEAVEVLDFGESIWGLCVCALGRVL
jgi:hypothetical protein